MNTLQSLLLLVGVVALVPNAHAAPNSVSGSSSNATNYAARFYVTANSGYYAATQNDCKANGFALASLPDAAEVSILEEFLEDQAVSKVWVGLRVSTRTGCTGSRNFDATCWDWDGLSARVPYLPGGVEWSDNAKTKLQNSLVRGYFDRTTLKLDFEENTIANRALCEMQAP